MDLSENSANNLIMFQCNFCIDMFMNRNEMWEHRKQAHTTFKPCRNMPNCHHGDNCVYSHRHLNDGMFLCYQCGDEFTSKHNMMKHIKGKHTQKLCKSFSLGMCHFS